MASWPGTFNSHHDASAWRYREYLEGVAEGQFNPVLFQHFWYGIGILLLHMLVPIYQGLALRLLTFSLVFAYDIWVILTCRAANPAASMALGILTAWNILWAAELLIFKDAKRKYKRVQMVRADTVANGGATNGSAEKKSNGYANGHSKGSSAQATSKEPYVYKWQPFPLHNTPERLAWAADLLTTFRGIAWNWTIGGLPSRPPRVEASLEDIDLAKAVENDRPKSKSGRKRFDSVRDLVVHNLILLALSYGLLDILKTAMNHDPYFWGVVDQPGPAYLPAYIRNSEVLTRVYRMFLGFWFIQGGLGITFAAIPLVFVCLLGPRLVGVNGEPWAYPNQFGAVQAIGDRGLAGYWGGWWHQIFRHGFQAGGKWLAVDVLRLKEGSPLAAIIELSTSFNLSGLMHVGLSTALIGPTNPWTDMLPFFVVQPVGIIAGLIWTQLLKQIGVRKLIPRWLGWMANFSYMAVWIYLTMPPLVKDLARGGIFLYEPIPFSPLRGLGLGAAGDGFNCWKDMYLAWYSDGTWWRTGIRM